MKAVKPFLAAAALLSFIGAAGPANADPGDSAFLASLDKMGIQYPDPTQAVASARQVCDYIAQGHTLNQAARGVKNANPDLPLTQASRFVEAAKATMCSQPSPASSS
jgi:hypothetical protein